jgi:hypothetical protein
MGSCTSINLTDIKKSEVNSMREKKDQVTYMTL